MRKIFLFGVLMLFLNNCRSENNGFILNGKIKGDYSGLIYLKYDNLIDSSLVSNNSFTFKGKVMHPVNGILYPGRPSSNDRMSVGTIMLENSPIKIFSKYSIQNTSLGMMKFLEIDSISGSKNQDLRDLFEDKMIKTVHNEKNDSLKKISLYNNLHEFISSNPKSVMSGEYLANLGTYYNDLITNDLETLLKLMDTSYQVKKDLIKIKSLIKQSKLFSIGKRPPNIELPNLEGEIISRLSFNGKVVLLEFWASWCVPCRETNPALLKIYNSHKNKGFEILGISIDRHKADWLSAIKEDNLSWTQVIDSLKITEQTYKLNSIPFNLLLNRKGEIIAQNIKPNELIQVLKNKL